MCRRVECAVCKKPSFVGCGRHIEEVLGDVPKDQRCKCQEKSPASVKKGFRLGEMLAKLWRGKGL